MVEESGTLETQLEALKVNLKYIQLIISGSYNAQPINPVGFSTDIAQTKVSELVPGSLTSQLVPGSLTSPSKIQHKFLLKLVMGQQIFNFLTQSSSMNTFTATCMLLELLVYFHTLFVVVEWRDWKRDYSIILACAEILKQLNLHRTL